MKLLLFSIALFLGTLAPQDRIGQALLLMKEGKLEEARTLCEEERSLGTSFLRAKELLDEINMWQEAIHDGSSKAIYGYLSNSRERVFSTEAVSLLPDILEREAWQEVLKADKPSRYRRYLEEHPDSKYRTEAINHLAQAMADNFKKNATLQDKEKVLENALDEPTREYVEYAYAAATHTLDPSAAWSPNTVATYQSHMDRKKTKVSVGVVATGAMGKHKWGAYRSQTDRYVTDYVAGAGVAVRLGDISKVANTVFSGYLLVNLCALPKNPKTVYSGALSFDENWNFYHGNHMAAFLTAGMLVELPWIAQFRGGVGTAWRHGEWKTGVFLYRSWAETPTMFVPLYGTSLTYFF